VHDSGFAKDKGTSVKNIISAVLFIALCWAHSAFAESVNSQQNFRVLDEKVQTIKTNIIKLGHDFALLEDGLTSISGKELVVYVSLAINDGFLLQALELTLNNRFAARYEFTQEVLDGLAGGGVKRIYAAKLPSGQYILEATLIGKVGKRHDYSNSVVLKFDKSEAPKTIELNVTNIREKFLPEFAVNEWD
jgi:hypothetical protein